MHPPLHTRIKLTRKTLGRTRWNCTKVDEGTAIGWIGCGFCFLGFRWHIVHRLFGIRKSIPQRLLLCIIGSIERRNRIKTTLFDKDKMLSSARQCTSLQINENDAKSNELRFNFLSHPPFYSVLSLSRFYLFPNLKRWLQGWRISSSEENK